MCDDKKNRTEVKHDHQSIDVFDDYLIRYLGKHIEELILLTPLYLKPLALDKKVQCLLPLIVSYIVAYCRQVLFRCTTVYLYVQHSI